MENLYIPEKSSENVINEEERKRCRSAMLQKVQKNEIVRKKKNELRLLQAKLKRKEEKQKFQTSKQFRLAPIREDREGEEIKRNGESFINRDNVKYGNSLIPKTPNPKAPVAPFAVKNRIQQRLTRVSSNLYLKVIQELLEMGDAIRVSRDQLARRNDNSSDSEFDEEYDDDDINEFYRFQDRLRQRKMSLNGVLEQSAAETMGFAALLSLKLKQLLIEDDIEQDAFQLSNKSLQEHRKKFSDSAPPYLSSHRDPTPTWQDEDFDEEGLNIVNETDSNPWNFATRGYISELTTPCATPFLSPDDLSPRTLHELWDESLGLPWRSETAPTSRTQTAACRRRPATGRPHGSAPPRVASPIELSYTRRSSISSDQPLYQSYYLGLDKVGLEEEDEEFVYDSDGWDSDYDDDDDDIYGVPDRTQSAPPNQYLRVKVNGRNRAKTCFPVINCTD